ncbi:MAG: hypothetical protein WAU24_03485 [Chitinophagaceae bacterium]
MPFLSLSILIIPVIAVLLNVLLYRFLLRNTNQKMIFNQIIVAILFFAFLFNAAWEILQIPLYKGGSYEWNHIVFCLLASVADVIMVLLLYFSFAFIYKNALWVKNVNPGKIIVLILTGGIGAILAESRHLLLGTWSYASAMPLIPVVDVGLSPVLQFMILPILVYKLSYKIEMNEAKRYE